MRLKKTMTPAAVQANQENSRNSSGPRSKPGKDRVSRNAWKHGIYSKNLRFRNEAEEASCKRLFGRLIRTVNDNPAAVLMAEVLAYEYIRYGRSMRLDSRLYKSHSPATEVLDAVRDSDLLNVPWLGPEDSNQWQCEEVRVSTGKGSEYHRKDANGASGSDDDKHAEVHAKFVDPVNAVLRCQAAARKSFYQALSHFERLQNKSGENDGK